MVAMIGRVENDEPIPMVTMRPTSSMASAAIALLSPTMEAEAFTNVSTSPVAVITEAKPCAEIMMNPMSAIIFMPAVNTSSDSFQFTAPVAMKMAKPTKAPTSRLSASESLACITTWTMKVAKIATNATISL